MATHFEEYVRAIDKMAKKNKRILFIVDNCPGHGKIKNLEAVTVEFLPANMTSVLQLMDQVCQRRGQMISETCEELCQEVIKLTGNDAAESDATFLEYTLCKQDAPVTGEMMVAEIIQTATNGGDGGDYEPPREVPTSAKTRNLLRLLRNKVECSGGEDRLMRCVKQLGVTFLGPSTTTKQTSRFRSSNGGVCGATLLSDGSVTKFQAELQFARHCTSRRRRTATTR
ncbi:hypothetical protein HPB50_002223 [Hyalomma asiaticum]|uniref:Uncharacterized protein n=1 Tax=Hyalomma asiaticum TaxID=266040 RepID=A0ACB7RJU0_HYAAI|nr:hypothetical protein HPB50_002223 [Hyalomma asiaticum]